MISHGDGGTLYNARLLEYPNGSVQIRLYSLPVRIGADRWDDTEEVPPGYEREPFAGRLVRKVDDFDQSLQQITDSQRASLSRTRRSISELARSAFWEWFCTFTFSPEKADRSNYKKCCKQMRNWLQNTRSRKAEELQYLAVPELHKDGLNWHFHVLLARTGKLKFTDSGKIKAGQRIYNIPGWTLGFSTATKVRDISRIQKYIVKYVTKECHLLALGYHRYFASQGLPKPKSSLFLVEPGQENAWVMSLAESLQMQVTWENTVCGNYMDIRYIELG